MIKGEEFHKRAEVGSRKSELGGYGMGIFIYADVANPVGPPTSDFGPQITSATTKVLPPTKMRSFSEAFFSAISNARRTVL